MAKQVVVDLKANTGDVQRGMDKLADAIADLNKALGGFNKEAEGLDDVADAAVKAESKFKRFGKTLSFIGKAGGIIFLLNKAFDFFKEVLGQNQVVVDATATSIEFLSIAFNDLFRFIQNNVGSVTGFFKSIFDDPKQSLIDFANAFKRNIQERFESYLDTLGFLASAVKKVFSGDFAGALEDVKNAGKESLDVLTGVDNTFEKSVETVGKVTKAVTEYTKSTYDSAKGTVELNKQVKIADALQQGLVEKYDLQAEQQRQIRDDESKSIEERIKANTRLGEILDQQEEEMLKNVKLRVEAAQIEFNKNQDNVEAKIALIEAENELAAVQATVAGFRSEQLTNINSLERERQDLLKETAQNEKDLAEKSLADNKRIQEQKAANIKGALSNIASIVGANSKFGKAIAIVQAIQDTYAGANKALAQGGIFGFIGAAAVISAGIANVKQITASKPPNPPASLGARTTGGDSTPSIPATTTPSLPPQFSTVGTSGTNQLADLLGNQPPPRAFVVSGDVSTAQELDRNIVTSASLG